METPPLETFAVTLPVVLEARGPGGLNTGLAEDTEVDEDEQGGEDCAEEWDEGNGRL